MKYKNAYKMVSHDWGKVASWFAFLRAHALPWKPYPVTIDEAYSFMYWANANSMNAPAQGEQDPGRTGHKGPGQGHGRRGGRLESLTPALPGT